MNKLYHYAKLILIPVIGNLYRLIYQAPANVIRFLYDFFRESPIEYIRCISEARHFFDRGFSIDLDVLETNVRYSYDGIDGSDTLQKWPTYTKTAVGFMYDDWKGNCMDIVRYIRATLGWYYKTRIYIPDLKLTKVHYLAEWRESRGNYHTIELVKSGLKRHHKTARKVMEERYPNNTIYRVW